MFNIIKEFSKRVINKIKYLNANNWIVKNKIYALGKCFKYDTENGCIYVKLVSIDMEKNMFTALIINIPNTIDNIENDKVLLTNEYGPYITGDVLPYKELSISFIDLNVEHLDNNLDNEIPEKEFSETLTSIMDKILKIGY